jgi:hypothetical protein
MNKMEFCLEDWGDLMKQRASPWGKRIQLLYRVNTLLKAFKAERAKFINSLGENPTPEKQTLKTTFGKNYFIINLPMQ